MTTPNEVKALCERLFEAEAAELIERAVQAALNAGVAEDGVHGVAAARVAARYVVEAYRTDWFAGSVDCDGNELAERYKTSGESAEQPRKNIILEMAQASREQEMWERRFRTLLLTAGNARWFEDADGQWGLLDFLHYAGEVCGYSDDR